jgi:hypothetical protein
MHINKIKDTNAYQLYNIVALSKKYLFGVNTTIELKNVNNTRISYNNVI